MSVFKICAIFLAILSVVYSEDVINNNTEKIIKEYGDGARNLVEQGRTFMHHALKRMAFIMPAIFFKMGIAFTLLMLVTVVSVNNGFIGFLLLIVGLSSVLARLQGTVPVQTITYTDRSDSDSSFSSQLPQPTTNYQNYPYYAGTDVLFKKYSS